MLTNSIQDGKYDEYVDKTDEIWSDIKNTCALLEDRNRLPLVDKVRILGYVVEQNLLYRRTVNFYLKKEISPVSSIPAPVPELLHFSAEK